jgi:glycolate oxidase iron-sulfur subunit
MQTNLHPSFKNTAVGDEAEAILRSCVHCGFCTATCPTYQEISDERDGPRGRIYLIKQLLETGSATEKTRGHLDKCLSCRSCETTCPSGVKYARLADLGKEIIEEQQTRPWQERFIRWSLRQVLPYRNRFTVLLRLGQLVRPIMPTIVKQKIPLRVKSTPWPKSKQKRTMLLLAGCAQPGATPNTNAAAARVLDKLGVTLKEAPKAGCCGAVSYHLSKHEEGLNFMRNNIDAWWPEIAAGAEAIIVTASGCGALVQDYGELLKNDRQYASKAKRVSELAKDLSQAITVSDIEKLSFKENKTTTAVHCPCSLQHALKLADSVEPLLQAAGLVTTKTKSKHLCCGSAGTYSILQPELSGKLLDNKLAALNIDNPDRIVTANVGCQLHLASKAKVPVQHWIELIDEAMI